MNKQPKITIVTVTYNAEKCLEATILSVINQTYPNIEYIVIDGGSKDGTVDIIKKYAEHIDYWVSEPDKGIYDAMNKGWKISNGEWIYYLGSDDILLKNGLTSLIDGANSGADVIYGNIIYDKDWGKIEKKAYPPKCLSHFMCCSHQAAIMKKNVIAQLNGFNTDYAVIADFDLFQRAYLKQYIFKYVDKTIAVFCMRGVSSYNLSLEFERYHILKNNHSVKVPELFFIYHFCRKVLSIIRYKIKKHFSNRN